MNNTIWLYGKHACFAALANTNRKCKRLLVSKNMAEQLPHLPKNIQPKICDNKAIESNLPKDAVHQGIAMEVEPLKNIEIKNLLLQGNIIILDQVTDPHNVGAILRSAAAFNAEAVIIPKDNAVNESGTLAKSASGALEIIPIVRVTNLVRAMEILKENNYWCLGMDGSAKNNLAEINKSGKNALVMGAEGAGLRRLTAEKCDMLVKLPISDKVESLNVSNAAAIALYELGR